MDVEATVALPRPLLEEFPGPILEFRRDLHEVDVLAVPERVPARSERIVGPYLLGDTFTAADVAVHTELFWIKALALYPEGIKPLDAFYERVDSHLA